MTRGSAEAFGELEAAGLLDLLAGEVGRQLVGLVEDDEVPARARGLLLELVVSGELVEPNDELVSVLERVAAWRGELHLAAKDLKLQAELLEQLVPPLLEGQPDSVLRAVSSLARVVADEFGGRPESGR